MERFTIKDPSDKSFYYSPRSFYIQAYFEI